MTYNKDDRSGSLTHHFRPSSGSLYILVIFFIMGITVLAAKFFEISRQQQSATFRLEQNLTAMELAKAGREEAFKLMVSLSADADSDFFSWVTDSRSANEFTLTLSATNDFAQQIAAANISSVLDCVVRKIDFRSESHLGIAYTPENEGQGVLAIEVRVALYHGLPAGRRKILSGKLLSHHDYSVVAMVSRRDNSVDRTGYVQPFALDYALMVRNGLQEFRYNDGQIANLSGFSLTIDQEDLSLQNAGKIYFGGADSSNTRPSFNPPFDNYVFFNIHEDYLDAIPAPPRPRVEIEQAQVLELIPDLVNVIRGLEGLNASLHNVRGVFEIVTAPTFRREYFGPTMTLEKSAIDKLAQIAEGANGNMHPFSIIPGSAEKLSSRDFLAAVFEGSIRKRFLYFVHFYVDAAEAFATFIQSGVEETQSISDADVEELKRYENRILCLPYDPDIALTEENEYFLSVLNQRFSELDGISLVSHFNASHPFGLQPDAFFSPAADYSAPVFFNSANRRIDCFQSGYAGFRPYNNFELWARRRLSISDLETIGIIDPVNKVIRLSGIIHISETEGLELGEGEWRVEGRGVIVAPGFSLRGSITRSAADDMLVLYARKNGIVIDTSGRIEASLIAVNDNMSGFVRVLQQLDLKGALVVDQLRPETWASGDHRIEYDSLLKSPDKDLYSVNISKWKTFQNWSLN